MQMNQISLDINKSGQIINEPVVLRVGEEDQTITVNLLKDGQPYTSFTTATFFANKPSGAIVANDPANISSGTITYTVPQALVNEFGKITNAYFLIDGKVSTESFVIAVLQGVNISDDLNDYIPGMSNLNVIYDKWKDKLQVITDELNGVDAPKEVKNIIDNELKNYTDQVNELQRRITAAETQLDALEVPEIGGRNYLLGTTNNLITGNVSNYGAGVSSYTVNMVCSADTTFTARAWLHPYSHPMAVQIAWLDASKHWQYSSPEYITAGSSGYSTCTITIPAGGTLQYVTAVFDKNETDTTRIDCKEFKLEKGNVATDWTPAPEDKVNVADMRKPASDVAGIEEVNVKADDSKVVHDNHDGTVQINGHNINPFNASQEGDQPYGLDFNNYTSSGNYRFDNVTTINYPSMAAFPNYWQLIVFGNGSSVYQIADGQGITAVRQFYAGSGWNPWIRVADDSKVVHTSDTITATDDTGKTVKLKITGIS